MNRTRIVVCTLTVALALASVAGAAPTPEEKCIAAKLDAQRKKRFCVAGAQRAAILGKTADVAKCTTKFDKQIAAADKAAAAKGTSCRWLDVGDGTDPVPAIPVQHGEDDRAGARNVPFVGRAA